MTMLLDLRYGRSSVRAELHADEVLELRAPLRDARVGEAEAVTRALDEPHGAPPLERLARGARRVAILVSGKDRVAGAATYVPLLLERLARAGVDDERIDIVCATGTHARHTPDDVRALIGPEAAARVRFRAHDCDRAESFADLGRTPLGTPLRLDRETLLADLRVLTGRVSHHYFAGFSGGRKSILPGVAARETIVANHRRVLDFGASPRIHPAVFGGNLVGNPVHEDMLAAARRAGPCFVLNTAIDREGRVASAFAGELEAAHLQGCAEVDRTCFLEIDRPADVVVASAGGWPSDLNFIQSVKGLFNHREAARPGGAFVLVADAGGGILRGLREWMAFTDRRTLTASMEARYDLAAHNSYLLRETLDVLHVGLVSSLPPEDVRALGLVPAATLDDALRQARDHVGRIGRAIVVHQGNATWSARARRGVLAATGETASAA